MEAGRRLTIWRRLQAMAALQRAHNEQVHPQWASQGYEYYRAVWVECAELLDHVGWKWWKEQQMNAEQAKLEVVDIWHFGLSDLLRRRAVDQTLAARLVDALASDSAPGLCVAVERLAAASLASRRFDIAAFGDVMRSLPMDFDELYEIYVAKNVLNRFRQDNGYRTGGYRKRWHGREDNEHLSELLGELDSDAASFQSDLYRALASRYRVAVSSASSTRQ